MANLEGKTILITGSTDGIGKQTARELAAMGATVIIHGRNAERVLSAVNETKQYAKTAAVEPAIADLSSLQNIRALADDLHKRFSTIDTLINNAGVYMREKVLSEDGYEMTFAVNHLAHFLLTNLLLDLLRKSPSGRIIHVSSIAHTSGRMDFDNLQAEKYFDAYGSYALSKLSTVLFSKELSLRLKGTEITSNALHPGVINTKLLRTGFNIHGADVANGALTPVFLASSADVVKSTGRYFTKCRETSPSPLAENSGLRTAFWNESMRLTGLQ